MTENEAIIFIQKAMEESKKVLTELLMVSSKVFAVKKKNLGEYYGNLENCKNEIHACEVAINALEKIQQYQVIGTPEEFRKTMEICKAMATRNITIENMEEYMKFEDECVQRGFTFDSLLDAREKQTAKKPLNKWHEYYCSACHTYLDARDWESKYCSECGQKIDWNEEE